MEKLHHPRSLPCGPAPHRLSPAHHANGTTHSLHLGRRCRRLLASSQRRPQLSGFIARTGIDPQPALRSVLAPYVDLGFAELTPTAARITDRGVAVSDHILKRVLAAMEEQALESTPDIRS